MGAFNTIITPIQCPRCGSPIERCEIECKFGNTASMSALGIGDRYPWALHRAIQNGGRPDAGNLDADGYSECPSCAKDFFLRIVIRDDVIVRAEPHPNLRGYIT